MSREAEERLDRLALAIGDCIESSGSDPSSVGSDFDIAQMPETVKLRTMGEALSETSDFDDFELGQQLGAGGMGTVFRARQISLDREVAIKFMSGISLESKKARERFEREARAAAKIQHPDICTIYEYGDYRGSPFLVMELVEGTPLSSVLAKDEPISTFYVSISSATNDDGDLELEDSAPTTTSTVSSRELRDAARFMARCAQAIEKVHQAGIVHRDLKPANISVRPDGSPVILDFGLATDLRDDSVQLTQDGAVVGTPYWMAPEQVDGKNSEIDGRTDVYALGVILYECLTGERPHRADTVEALYMSIRLGEARSPRLLNRRIPADLDAVCMKAIAPDPGARYQSAAEFAEDLERFLRGEPTRARPVGVVTRTWKRVRRRPWRAVSAAALLLAAIFFVIWLFDDSAEETVDFTEALLSCFASWGEGKEANTEHETTLRKLFPDAESFAAFRASPTAEATQEFLELLRARHRDVGVEQTSPRASVEGGRPTFRFTPDLITDPSRLTFVIDIHPVTGDPVRHEVKDLVAAEDGSLSWTLPKAAPLPPGRYRWLCRVRSDEEPLEFDADSGSEFEIVPPGTIAGIRDRGLPPVLTGALLLARGLAAAALSDLSEPAPQPEIERLRQGLRARAAALLGRDETADAALDSLR